MILFDHLPCPALLMHEDLTILQANEAVCSLLSDCNLEDDMVSLSTLCAPEEVEALRDTLSELEAGGQKNITLTFNRPGHDDLATRIALSRLPEQKVLLLLTDCRQRQETVSGRNKLRILEEQYEHNPAGILLVNDRMEMLSYNRQFLQMWNIPVHVQQNRDDNESLQTVLAQLKNPQTFLDKVQELYQTPDQSSTDEVELKDGRTFYRHSYPIFTDKTYLGRVWYFLDITPLKAAQRKIIRQQKFQRAVLENMQDGIVACNTEKILTIFNRASREIHGCDPAHVPVKEWGEYYQLYHTDGITPLRTDEIPLVRAFEGEQVRNQEMLVISTDGKKRELRANGQAMYDNEGNKLGAVISLHDITDLKQAKKKLQYLAYHDALTDLPNRRMFHDLLEQNIRRARRNKEKTAVLFLDLDNFKRINDRHGHEAGDRLLIDLATILRVHLRDSDILCRWGGDEFLIALPEITSSGMARRVAKKICGVVEDELATRCNGCEISTSIGVALYPDHGQNPDMLIRRADMAMYLAKQGGKNQYHLAPEGDFLPDEEQCNMHSSLRDR
ncbi:MAG TPA: diguanylate cyclase [Desulfobulbus sp.]|nr:diguanylate cyclase [Desulfobulbus sp.]